MYVDKHRLLDVSNSKRYAVNIISRLRTGTRFPVKTYRLATFLTPKVYHALAWPYATNRVYPGR